MIEALRDGTIDAIATDHAPHTPEEKADFLKAPNGSIGMGDVVLRVVHRARQVRRADAPGAHRAL